MALARRHLQLSIPAHRYDVRGAMIAFEDILLIGIFVRGLLLFRSPEKPVGSAARRANGGDKIAILEGTVRGLRALMTSPAFSGECR